MRWAFSRTLLAAMNDQSTGNFFYHSIDTFTSAHIPLLVYHRNRDQGLEPPSVSYFADMYVERHPSRAG